MEETCACGCWCGPVWESVCDRWRTGMLAEQPQAQEAPAAAAGERIGRPDPQAVRLALDRPGRHGRTHRRHRRRREQPSTFYVGFATGGIWKTVNNGTTWTPIFDEYPVSSIGDIELAPSNPNIIYVGTGEPNNRQSSSFGAGVYKSTDGGKTSSTSA